MDNRTHVFTYLVEHKTESCSIRSIALALKMNYRIAFDTIKTLERQNLIKLKKIGNTNQCTLTYSYGNAVLGAETIRKENLLKNKNLKVLYNNIQEIHNPFFICLIFGSYAKGNQKKGSDIDLCIVADSKELQEKLSQRIRTLALPINLIEFSVAEFTSMLKINDQNVGKEIVINNIVLKGIESFYELVKNA